MMAEVYDLFVSSQDTDSLAKVYVPGPPAFILGSQTTFQLIWLEYLDYSDQETLDAFCHSLDYTKQTFRESTWDEMLDFLLARGIKPQKMTKQMIKQMMKEIERQVQEMVSVGIVEPSDSTWNAPCVLIKKSGSNEYRVVNDV